MKTVTDLANDTYNTASNALTGTAETATNLVNSTSRVLGLTSEEQKEEEKKESK